MVPVRANMEAFSPIEVGLLGTVYFLGFTLGCVYGPGLVRRSGHIRAYLAMTSLASVITLMHAIYVTPVTWWVLRAITGFCFAVLYIVIESWLNARSDNRTRGTVFSIYTAINLTVITVGQLMLGLASPASFSLFATASILVLAGGAADRAYDLGFAFAARGVPAALQEALQRVACRLCRLLAVGLANGSFWALGPVFAQNQGFDMTGIATFMSAVVLGGALLQWPLGSLSDRIDRRIVMVLAAFIALLAAIAMTFIPAPDSLMTILAAAVFGAGAFPLYALAVAHANDNANASDCVEVSSGLLLIYGLGAAAGPLLASLMRQVMVLPTLFHLHGPRAHGPYRLGHLAHLAPRGGSDGGPGRFLRCRDRRADSAVVRSLRIWRRVHERTLRRSRTS